jgi:hypothetical protein
MKIFSSISIGISLIMVTSILSQDTGSSSVTEDNTNNDNTNTDNTSGDNTSTSDEQSFVCKAEQSNIEIVN